MLFPGDLFAALKGATKDGKMIGSVARVPDFVPAGRLTQDTVKLEFIESHEATRTYIYWLLRTPQYREYCAGRAMGSAVVALSREDFLSYPVPPLTAARAQLVDLLEEIERRCRVLRETNATLEAIAQALFKSWFVDFEPVCAKLEGRAPEGMVEAIAALFPGGFEESKLGLVPMGWRAASLAELMVDCGGTIQTGPFGSQLHASDYVESGIPVVMPKDIQGRRVDAATTARIRPEDADRLERHKLKPGDIVFSRRGDVERHALISEREVGWLCGTGCLLVRPGPSFLSSSFLSITLDAPRARQWLVQHAVGATMPNLNTSILGSVPIVLPDAKVLEAYEGIVSATEAQITQNSEVANTLGCLRDMLLPRLISGEVRLSEAAALAA
jgi:type I restriction enzyme S subunit